MTSKTNTAESNVTISPDLPDNEVTVTRFRADYSAADVFARDVANFRDDVSIPAHNELRYAGYHFLQAVDDDGNITDKTELLRAINHCQRAIYEAADAGILSTLDMIQIFRKDYSRITVMDVVPNYQEIIRDARDGNNLLTAARKHDGEAPIIPSIYKDTFIKLRGHVETLEDSREEMNKKVKAEQKSSRRFIIGIVVTILLGGAGIGVTLNQISAQPATAAGQISP